MKQRRNEFAILAEESQGSRAVSRHGSRWEDNVIKYLDKVGYECVD
jgi:hypothetical protein